MRRRPLRCGPADIEEKGVDDLAASHGVRYLGMELNREQWSLEMLDPGNRGVVARDRGAESGRQRLDAVAVTHPHRRGFSRIEGAEQPPAQDGDPGSAIFAA